MGFANALRRYTCSLPFQKNPAYSSPSPSSSPTAAQHPLNHTQSEEDLIPENALRARHAAAAPFEYPDAALYRPTSQIVCHSPLDKRYRKSNRRSTMKGWENAALSLAGSKTVVENGDNKSTTSKTSSTILFSSTRYDAVEVGKGR